MASDAEIFELESKLGRPIPDDMREWLTTVGFCTFNEELNFQKGWFRRVEVGHLKGAVIFGQDELGSHYAFIPESGRIIYFAREEPAYAVLAESFGNFLEQFEARDFRLVDWVGTLPLLPYDWNAV